jgi:NADPH-dependent glutamate synthase beta subunit-like oxidoreductase
LEKNFAEVMIMFEEMAPCQKACPTHTPVPEFIRLIYEGDLYGAWKLNRLYNVFPAICSRVCPHYCEKDCKRGAVTGDLVSREPVAIRALKRFLVENLPPDYQERFLQETLPIKKVNKGVAVVGSGPAGLTVANDLILSGCDVTILETLSQPGGMLRVGIPPFRLPREVLDEEIELLKKLGIKFRFNTQIGRDISLVDLCSNHDAVFVATGAHKPLSLGIPGENLEGVYSGIVFLRKCNLGEPVEVRNQMVLVVGGGITASDSARTSLRLGAREVHLFYRRGREDMPMGLSALVELEEEGVQVHELVSPVEVLGKEKVAGLKCIRNKPGELDQTGRKRPIPIPGSEFELKGDIAVTIIATGEEADYSFLPEELEINPETQETSKEGLFVGGDFARPIRDVAGAVASGHRASQAIAKYLGLEERPQKSLAEFETLRCPWLCPDPERLKRQSSRSTVWLNTYKRFAEVDKDFTATQALKEAARCLQCNFSVERDESQCLYCRRCIDACPQNALELVFTNTEAARLESPESWFEDGDWHAPGDAVIRRDPKRCIQCGLCLKVCPMENICFHRFN